MASDEWDALLQEIEEADEEAHRWIYKLRQGFLKGDVGNVITERSSELEKQIANRAPTESGGPDSGEVRETEGTSDPPSGGDNGAG